MGEFVAEGAVQIDISALAREIAARMAPDALLDSEDVGALLKCSARNVMARYVPAPGFPKAIRLTTTEGKSQPRWVRSDIVAWVEKHRKGVTGRGGRPRANPDD